MYNFTLQEFFAMIADYNTGYWPVAIVAYALCVMAIVFALQKADNAGRARWQG
jgi:hypothetical protein